MDVSLKLGTGFCRTWWVLRNYKKISPRKVNFEIIDYASHKKKDI